MKLFKDGNTLPKRYVWEITLGAYSVFEKEGSLVELTLESGRSVDVIGDVHGVYLVMFNLRLRFNRFPRAILRCPQTVPTDRRTDGGSCSVDER